MTAFDRFRQSADAVRPTAAVVFGSGLAAAASPAFTPVTTIPYADIPGMAPPGVAGHRGELAVGHWAGMPTLVGFGRVHFYEGHPWERVTRLVRVAAGLGVSRVILTNAAGGIREDLNPGDLMAIRGHLKLLEVGAWLQLVNPERGRGGEKPDPLAPARGSPEPPYSLLAPDLPSGVYAALTGPCYETPAEIRGLRAIGADAVGMSTAVEAEAAAELGLVVAGVSCITNKAAGLGSGPLSHHEVEQTARTAVARLGAVLGRLLQI